MDYCKHKLYNVYNKTNEIIVCFVLAEDWSCQFTYMICT